MMMTMFVLGYVVGEYELHVSDIIEGKLSGKCQVGKPCLLACGEVSRDEFLAAGAASLAGCLSVGLDLSTMVQYGCVFPRHSYSSVRL